MKIKSLALCFTLTVSLVIASLVGCAPKQTPSPAATPTPTPNQTTPPETTPDVKTTASIVNTEANFEKAISNTGTWIICTVKDLTFTKELVVDGEFKNGKKDAESKDILQRKIALYTQDDKRVVTGRFTLTAPKLTFNSPYGSLEHGTFKGDLYISGKNFKLVNQKIDGNIYFLNEDAQKTFTIADGKPESDPQKTVITGKQELVKK